MKHNQVNSDKITAAQNIFRAEIDAVLNDMLEIANNTSAGIILTEAEQDESWIDLNEQIYNSIKKFIFTTTSKRVDRPPELGKDAHNLMLKISEEILYINNIYTPNLARNYQNTIRNINPVQSAVRAIVKFVEKLVGKQSHIESLEQDELKGVSNKATNQLLKAYQEFKALNPGFNKKHFTNGKQVGSPKRIYDPSKKHNGKIGGNFRY